MCVVKILQLQSHTLCAENFNILSEIKPDQLFKSMCVCVSEAISSGHLDVVNAPDEHGALLGLKVSQKQQYFPRSANSAESKRNARPCWTRTVVYVHPQQVR